MALSTITVAPSPAPVATVTVTVDLTINAHSSQYGGYTTNSERAFYWGHGETPRDAFHHFLRENFDITPEEADALLDEQGIETTTEETPEPPTDTIAPWWERLVQLGEGPAISWGNESPVKEQQETPQFLHPYDDDLFLGRYVAPNGAHYDLYVENCEGDIAPFLTVRWDDGRGDYQDHTALFVSECLEGDLIHPFSEAIRRAKERGLIQ